MDNNDDIFDLLSSKVSETEPLTENDWLKIDQKYNKSLFYNWSFDRMNIYYASLIAITFVGTIYILANYFNQNNSIELDTTINQTHQVSTPNDYPIDSQTPKIHTVSRSNHSAIEQNIKNYNPKDILNHTPNKNLNSNLNQKKTSETPNSDNIDASNTIFKHINTDSNSISSIEEKPIELPKKIKLPVIIYQQDTIFDIDSTKVSRRKISRMNN